MYYGLKVLGSLMYITAKKRAKDGADAQPSAEALPHFCAAKLIFWAREKPTSLAARDTVLSKRLSSFPASADMLRAKVTLRTLSATLIVNSISTRSILRKALNHTPARIALNLNVTSCALSKKPKVLPRGIILNTVLSNTLIN